MTVVLGSAVGSIDLNTRPAQESIQEMVRDLAQGAKATDALGDKMASSMRRAAAEARRGGVDIGEGIGGGIAQARNAISGEAENLAGGIRSALPDSLGTAIGLGLGGAIAGAFTQAVGVVKKSLDNFAQEGIALSKLQQSTGMAVEDLSALRGIARESDVSVEALSQGLMRFSRVIVDTKGPSADLRKELFNIADQFKNMSDGPAKADLAMRMFGRAGAELIPILNQGGEALQAYAKDLEQAGVVMDEKATAAALRYDDALDRIARSGQRAEQAIGGRVAPAAATAAEAFAAYTDTLSKTEDFSLALVSATLALQGALFGVGSSGQSAAEALYDATIGAEKLARAIERSQALYAGMRKASADWAASTSNVASAGAVIGGDSDKQFDRERRLLQATQDGTRAYGERVRAMQLADRESIRLGNANQRLTLAEQETADFADKVNASFERQAGGAGGAARATDELTKSTDRLADAQTRLEERTRGIGGAMGSNLEPMSDSEKFQTAWRVATGETTIAQLQQEAAVKGVMKALKDGSLSQEDALKTLLALRAGYIDAQGAMTQAGDAANPFAADVASVEAVTAKAIEGIRDLSLGIDSLPKKGVVLGIQVIGGDDLLDASTRMAAMKDRTVRLNIEILGNTDLFEVWGQLNRGKPGGGGAPAPAPAPAGDTGTPSGSTGNSEPTDASDRARGRQTFNFHLDSKVFAKAVVDNGATAAGTNRRRGYKG